jgi:hypothetical protein
MQAFTRQIPRAARVLLGLLFFVFGLNGFLHFLPQPPLEGAALAFVTALLESGFVMVLVKGVEVAAGAMLLSNRYVPLALSLLAPIIVVIVAFHALLAPSGMPIALLVLGLLLYLARAYRQAFAPMLQRQVEPIVPEAALQPART